MSDYSNSFNGAGKDAGNDIIYGADIDTQLDNVATASTTKSNKTVPASTNNVATLSGTGDLQDSGYSFSNMTGDCTATEVELNIMDGVTASTAEVNQLAGITVANIPSGTLMLFQQTAAPTGWTKETTHNNKALRVVSGSASYGGTVNFSTTFGSGKATDGHTLLITEMPAHTHAQRAGNTGGGDNLNYARGDILPVGNVNETASTGGGSSHAHNLSNFDIKYVDLIIASKD